MNREQFIEFKQHHTISKIYLDKNKEYYDFMVNWSPLLSSDFYNDMTRINWIFNDRHNFLSCVICNNILSGNATSYTKIGYPKTCCHDCRYKNMHQETRNTCIRLYGVTNNLHIPEVEKQIEENNIKKYGHKIPFAYGTQEFLNLMQDRYGDKHYNNREQTEITNLERYGNKNGIAYGTEQFKELLLARYGVKYASQKYEFRKKSKQKYFYDYKYFDSIPEIAFYIWLTDNKIQFEYEPNIEIQYSFNDKKYRYFPDFKVNNDLIEIKGDQFFTKDGKMKCPFKNKTQTIEQYELLCQRYEAKHQCMLANNVIILRPKDYKKYINYINEIYGKNFLKQFKQSNKV